MIRSDIPRITDHALRMSMLATLDHENAVDFFGKKAQEQDQGWVRAAMEAGAFDISRDVFSEFAISAKNIEKSAAMLDALLRFTQDTATTSSDQDPVYGKLVQHTNLLRLESTDEFRDLYASVVDRWMLDLKDTNRRLDAHPMAWVRRTVDELSKHTDFMAMKLMVGAIALDCPDVLDSLVQAFPDVLYVSTDPRGMMPSVMDSTLNSELSLMPYGFSLQYGRLDCMELIEDALPGKCPPVANAGIASTMHALNAAQLHGAMTPLCHPSLYAHAMRVCFERDPELDKSSILEGALTALGLEEELKRHQMWPAYLDLGIYELDAPASFEAAVKHGNVPVLESFEGRVPWAEMDNDPQSSLLIRTLEFHTMVNLQKQHHQAVVRMIGMAKAEGELDRVLRLVARPEANDCDGRNRRMGPLLVTPLDNLIDMEHREVLHEMLKHTGLKPNDPPMPGAWTLQKMADAHSDSIAEFFRSYTARSRAHDLIAEMDSSPAHSAISP